MPKKAQLIETATTDLRSFMAVQILFTTEYVLKIFFFMGLSGNCCPKQEKMVMGLCRQLNALIKISLWYPGTEQFVYVINKLSAWMYCACLPPTVRLVKQGQFLAGADCQRRAKC